MQKLAWILIYFNGKTNRYEHVDFTNIICCPGGSNRNSSLLPFQNEMGKTKRI